MPMKMVLLLSKVFLAPVSPLEKHVFNQKPPLFLFLLSLLVRLLIPILLFASSFTSILKFWYRVLAELACFGKMEAHETAWKCGCFSGGTEEAMELKPSHDKI